MHDGIGLIRSHFYPIYSRPFLRIYWRILYSSQATRRVNALLHMEALNPFLCNDQTDSFRSFFSKSYRTHCCQVTAGVRDQKLNESLIIKLGYRQGVPVPQTVSITVPEPYCCWHYFLLFGLLLLFFFRPRFPSHQNRWVILKVTRTGELVGAFTTFEETCIFSLPIDLEDLTMEQYSMWRGRETSNYGRRRIGNLPTLPWSS